MQIQFNSIQFKSFIGLIIIHVELYKVTLQES